MKRFICGVITTAIILCLCASTVSAQTISYVFTGAEGFSEPHGLSLTGGFILDQNATVSNSTWGYGGEGSFSIYSSPLQQIWGTFGDWTFSGSVDIYVLHGPAFFSNGVENLVEDYWIPRSTITGPDVNGLTPRVLNLFYYTSPGGLGGTSLLPPHDPLTNPNTYDFQFALAFADAQGGQPYVGGQLSSIQSVPEPSAAMLVVMGLTVLSTLKQRRRA